MNHPRTLSDPTPNSSGQPVGETPRARWVGESLQDWTCSICLETAGRRKVRLHCGHVFHRGCIVQVEDISCPLCRSKRFPKWLKQRIRLNKPAVLFDGLYEHDGELFEVVLSTEKTRRRGVIVMYRVEPEDEDDSGTTFGYTLTYSLRTQTDINDLLNDACEEYSNLRREEE